MRHFEGYVRWLQLDDSRTYLLSTVCVVHHLFWHYRQRWLATDLTIVEEAKIVVERVFPLFNRRHGIRLYFRPIIPLLNTGFVFLFKVVSLFDVLDGLSERIVFNRYSLVIIWEWLIVANIKPLLFVKVLINVLFRRKNLRVDLFLFIHVEH